MDICELESVCAVDTYRNYSEAAFRIASSASVVSKHVQRVEEKFGVRIFERATKSKPVELTAEGAELMGYFRTIVDAYRCAQETAERLSEADLQVLNVGYRPLIGNFKEKDILTAFSLENPNIIVQRKAESNPGLIRLLLSGGVDAIFLPLMEGSDTADSYYAPLADANVELLTLFANHTLTIGLPEGHPLAGASIITPDQFPLLQKETFLFSNAQMGSVGIRQRKNIQKLLNFTEPMKIRFVDYAEPELALRLVESGAGVLPQACFVPEWLGRIRFVPVDGWNEVSTLLYFVYRKDHLSPPLEKLLRCAQAFSVEMNGKGGAENP